jgi:hypothetical protein
MLRPFDFHLAHMESFPALLIAAVEADFQAFS